VFDVVLESKDSSIEVIDFADEMILVSDDVTIGNVASITVEIKLMAIIVVSPDIVCSVDCFELDEKSLLVEFKIRDIEFIVYSIVESFLFDDVIVLKSSTDAIEEESFDESLVVESTRKSYEETLLLPVKVGEVTLVSNGAECTNVVDITVCKVVDG